MPKRIDLSCILLLSGLALTRASAFKMESRQLLQSASSCPSGYASSCQIGVGDICNVSLQPDCKANGVTLLGKQCCCCPTGPGSGTTSPPPVVPVTPSSPPPPSPVIILSPPPPPVASPPPPPPPVASPPPPPVASPPPPPPPVASPPPPPPPVASPPPPPPPSPPMCTMATGQTSRIGGPGGNPQATRQCPGTSVAVAVLLSSSSSSGSQQFLSTIQLTCNDAANTKLALVVEPADQTSSSSDASGYDAAMAGTTTAFGGNVVVGNLEIDGVSSGPVSVGMGSNTVSYNIPPGALINGFGANSQGAIDSLFFLYC